MFDMTNNSAPAPAWNDTIQHGDVVLFHFPCAEGGATGTPKSRTCLVLDVQDRDGRRFVELAYGTSVASRLNVGHEIDIFEPAEMTAAGVRKPTRFVGARRVIVAVDHSGWDLNPRHATPVIGHLGPLGMARMNDVRARIEAMRDIAAERRDQRGRPITVEHRNRRSEAIARRARG